MGFLKCALYSLILGFGSFLLGRVLPASLFPDDRFPYTAWAWERGGTVYNAIGIRKWQARVPDMSRIFPQIMQVKKVTGNFKKELPRMITETCIAEFIHAILCILVLPCFWLWPGWGGIAFVTVYILVNIPFILIQRYNRPRLVKLRDKMAQRALEKEA